jgi:hypothetical protein
MPLPRMRNPRELPSLVREAIARVRSGESVDQAANWVWFHGASRAERDAVDTYIIETKHRLGFEAGTAEQRFKELIRESVREKNPRELRKYREIGRGIDFDGWYKITLETIPDHRIVKVSKKRFADLKRAGRIEGNLEKNPIRRVKGGYRWGEHGHVYPTRAGALRQARAAFAHGYRERNPVNRHERPKAHRAYDLAKRADERFQRELVRVYGSKRAGDMRYRGGYTDARLRAAERQFKRATKVLQSVWAQNRARNPAPRPDAADRQHFLRWVENERVKLSTRNAMWKLFSSDPDYYGSLGWPVVLERVQEQEREHKNR